MMCTRHNH